MIASAAGLSSLLSAPQAGIQRAGATAQRAAESIADGKTDPVEPLVSLTVAARSMSANRAVMRSVDEMLDAAMRIRP